MIFPSQNLFLEKYIFRIILDKEKKLIQPFFQKNMLKFFQNRADDSSSPVCSVSCTVHLQLFTNIDIL